MHVFLNLLAHIHANNSLIIPERTNEKEHKRYNALLECILNERTHLYINILSILIYLFIFMGNSNGL